MAKNRLRTIVIGLVALSVLSVGFTGAVSAGDAVVAQQETPEDEPEDEIGEEPEDEIGEEPEDEVDEEPEEEPDPENETETDQTAEVTAENQTSNGTVVMVNSTTLPEGGFVVAYNATLAEPLGNSTFLENGSQEDVNITLDQSLSENQTLVVFAFQDTDGNEQFDLGTDEVYMSDRQPVADAPMVNVTAENATSAGDNETTPTPTPAE